jgi:hypothetical protein
VLEVVRVSRKTARQQQALARERDRRRVQDQRRLQRAVAAEQAAADAGVDLLPVTPALDPRPNPATAPRLPAAPPRPAMPAVSSAVSSGSGRRVAGQQVACGWCGQPALVRSRGPVPKWCSPACRHRAWEQDRAARSGRSAVQVLDRYVTAVPADTLAWIEQLAALATQLSDPATIPTSDLEHLGAALELAQAAIATRTRGPDRPHRW